MRRWCCAEAVILCAMLSGCAAGSGQGHKIRDVWLPVSQDEWKLAAVKDVTLYRTDKSRVAVVSANVVARLIEVKERLERAGGARAELALVDSDQPNAFAFKYVGRRVIAFTLSWLDKFGQDADAIATVMGHELAHVHLGHSAVERREREKSAREMSHVAGLLMSIVGVPFGGAIAGVAASAYERSFTRDEERAADDLGMKWSIAAGYDPCGLRRVMMMYESMDRLAPHPWLSTHPGYTERAEIASRLARETGSRSCI